MGGPPSNRGWSLAEPEDLGWQSRGKTRHLLIGLPQTPRPDPVGRCPVARFVCFVVNSAFRVFRGPLRSCVSPRMTPIARIKTHVGPALVAGPEASQPAEPRPPHAAATREAMARPAQHSWPPKNTKSTKAFRSPSQPLPRFVAASASEWNISSARSALAATTCSAPAPDAQLIG